MFEKFKNMMLNIGSHEEELTEEYVDEYDTSEDEIDYKERYPKINKPDKTNLRVIPTQTTQFTRQAKVCICKPKTIAEAQHVCDNFKDNSICVINLEGVDRVESQRVADFLSGACYLACGTLERVTDSTFIIAPEHVPITPEIKEDLKDGSYTFLGKKLFNY